LLYDVPVCINETEAVFEQEKSCSPRGVGESIILHVAVVSSTMI